MGNQLTGNDYCLQEETVAGSVYRYTAVKDTAERQVKSYSEEIGLKLAMELSRVGKKKEKATLSVQLTLSSSSTAYQIHTTQ